MGALIWRFHRGKLCKTIRDSNEEVSTWSEPKVSVLTENAATDHWWTETSVVT